MDRVWYVAYGSNLGTDRFRCYLAGGRPDGGTRTYAGCRDPSDPAGRSASSSPVRSSSPASPASGEGAWRSSTRTATGSVACRAYLLTAGAVRGRGRPGDAARARRRVRAGPGGGAARGRRAAPRWVPAATRRWSASTPGTGVPLLTVTNGDIRGLALAAPSAAYLRSIATGLREAHGWDDARIASYLAAAPGARGSWTTAAVLEALQGRRVVRPVIDLDSTSSTPPYEQIRSQVADHVDSGALSRRPAADRPPAGEDLGGHQHGRPATASSSSPASSRRAAGPELRHR